MNETKKRTYFSKHIALISKLFGHTDRSVTLGPRAFSIDKSVIQAGIIESRKNNKLDWQPGR